MRQYVAEGSAEKTGDRRWPKKMDPEVCRNGWQGWSVVNIYSSNTASEYTISSGHLMYAYINAYVRMHFDTRSGSEGINPLPCLPVEVGIVRAVVARSVCDPQARFPA